ncbi:MAG: alpha/beta fold hydrolase [Thermonemataceae bacterium]
MDINNWQAKGQFFDYKGYQIFYVVEGNPQHPTLLCLHGYPTASYDWHKIWKTLVQHFRVITLDMLGFGFSAKPSSYDYTIQDQADLVEQLLAKLGITHLHLLAHNYGDTVAQELLARQEESKIANTTQSWQLSSICFLNGGLFPETHRPKLIQKLLLTRLGPWIVQLYSKRSFKKTFREIFSNTAVLTEATYDTYWALMTRQGGKQALQKLIRYMKERVTYRDRWVQPLIHTKIPIRLINGTEDPISGAHMVQRYQALVPHTDIVELSEVGHYPQIESPEKVLEAYLAFISQLRT